MAAIGSSSGSNFKSKINGKSKNLQTALYSLMVLFFMMGFITCLNDILQPYFKKIFQLTLEDSSKITLVFFSAYGIMSFPSSIFITKYGHKKGMVIGFLTAAMGCFLFFPAVTLHSYDFFLFALGVLATGIVFLQVAGNPYVAILGSPETASSRLTLAQALNSFGTTIAPFFGAKFILSAMEKSQSAEAVRIPYLLIGGLLVLIAVILIFMNLPEIEAETPDQVEEVEGTKKHAWQYSHLIFGALAIFTYVGAEVAIGFFMVEYFGKSYVLSLSEHEAAPYVAFYWGSAMVGRFIGSMSLNKDQHSDFKFIGLSILISVAGYSFISILQHVLKGTPTATLVTNAVLFSSFAVVSTLVYSYLLKLRKPGYILAYKGIVAALLVGISILMGGQLSLWTIILVGFCNSIMFPTIFTLAVDGLGKHTTQGAGILSTAIIGGAIIPWVISKIAAQYGEDLRIGFAFALLCYLYIAWFGMKGHKRTV